MRNTAHWHDAIVNLAAHPIGWPLARLSRRLGPVVRIPHVGIVINDAELAHEILQRDGDFTKNGPGSIAEIVTQLIGPFALINMDGEEHARLRSRLADVLSPSHARELLGACDEPLARLRDDLVAGHTVDLVRFMRYLSGRLTFAMLGVVPRANGEEADCDELAALGNRIASAVGLRALSPRRRAGVQADCDRLTEYTRDGYESASAPPQSLVHRLRTLGLSFDEAKSILAVFFLTGTITTAATLPRIVALLLDSSQMGRLREDNAALPSAIHEALRYTAPVPATLRIAQRAMRVQGYEIPAGARVVILTCNLARDRRLFPQADRFDVARVMTPRARHLWFGAGPHFCLGFALAHRELQLVLEALLTAPGELVIVRRRATFNTLIPGYARLDLRLQRRSA